MNQPETTDFVWVYSKMGEHKGDIQNSIKSVEKFFKGPTRRIFIVGDTPNPFNNRWTVIPHKQVVNTMHAKATDALSKLITICKTPEINNKFVYMYDDQIFLKDFHLPMVEQSVANDHVKTTIDYWKRTGDLPSTNWRAQFLNTFMLLKQRDKPTWNYETHTPKVLEKHLINSTIEFFDLSLDSLQSFPVLFNTLYGNLVRLNPDIALDRPNDIKAGIYFPRHTPQIKELCFNKLVLSFNDNGITPDLEKFIKDLLYS